MNANKGNQNMSSSMIFLLFSLFGTSFSYQVLLRWNDPTWTKPRAFPLQWREKTSRNKYAWGDSLSILTMEEWVKEAIESLFVIEFRSQVLDFFLFF